ncbi:ParB family chromosome partitioning protein [Nocardia tenerifensis]|uniref:ParB family chromosome partitioning protein n=1 Tax=Nocardia tenerifensis TaxID=228006 RepID=A0A318JSK5_9NOCA|nr:ParB/RepB/Spo0J family partition protein [Nocardia tenerifensis]PXX53428.1 ParB family chromosome partitioning protein [Nocardia tenerifensis]
MTISLTSANPETQTSATESDDSAAEHQPIAESTDSDPTPSVQAEAVFLPPSQLVIDENVRKSFDIGDYPDLTDSIRHHGVINPIKAHRESDGTITVLDGQVRTLTALAFDVPEVPVWITPAPALDTAERAISRIAQQISVTDQRIPLTEGDRAAGIAEMFAFGASITRISKDVGHKRDQVKLAVTVGASATARQAVDTGQLDFEQAAVIADYEAVGDTDAVQRLSTVSRSMFNYEAKRIAANRAESRDRFLESLPYAALGFGVLTSEPDAADQRFVDIDDLRTDAGSTVLAETIHAHPSCWVVYCRPSGAKAVLDRDTGAVVASDTVDWNTQGRPDIEAADGLRHADSVEVRAVWAPTYYLRADRLPDAGVQPATAFAVSDDAVPDDADPHVDDQRGGRSADAQPAAQQEAERVVAERRQNQLARKRAEMLNKQGDAALAARRKFLKEFLTRKTPPTQAAVFVAESLADEPGLLGEYNADRTAWELLGITGWRNGLLQAVGSAKPARCQVVTLGLVLGAYEKRTDRSCWKHNARGVRRYLQFLAEHGHHLTPVEQAATGDLDPETIDINS